MKRIDLPLLFIVIGLTLFGLLMIYDASSVIAFRDFHGDKFHYIRDQLIWAVLGIVLMLIASQISYKLLFNLAPGLLVVSLLLLIAVFIPGIGIHVLGANRWIDLHFFILQPAEFVKLSLAIYLAAWFSHKERSRFLAFSLLVGLIFFLVIIQPDMGTGMIILSEAALLYILSGGSLQYALYVFPVGAILGFLLIKLAPYRAARLTSYLNVDRSISGVSYHMKQILIALGSGGILGLGLGNSMQKYAYLPENVTDSIFAIIAEELGLFGCLILIIVFMFLIWRGFFIAAHVKDMFGKLLSAGIITFLGVQIIINLGSMTALLPLTGVPLPFISYGGSALLIDLSAIGILLNISKHVEKR